MKKKTIDLIDLYKGSKTGKKWKDAAKDMTENKSYYFNKNTTGQFTIIYRIKDYILEYQISDSPKWNPSGQSAYERQETKWYKATLKTSKKLKYGKD